MHVPEVELGKARRVHDMPVKQERAPNNAWADDRAQKTAAAVSEDTEPELNGQQPGADTSLSGEPQQQQQPQEAALQAPAGLGAAAGPTDHAATLTAPESPPEAAEASVEGGAGSNAGSGQEGQSQPSWSHLDETASESHVCPPPLMPHALLSRPRGWRSA